MHILRADECKYVPMGHQLFIIGMAAAAAAISYEIAFVWFIQFHYEHPGSASMAVRIFDSYEIVDGAGAANRHIFSMK